ncbi:microfibril-associated glycoprotein 4-like [Littorina saxatilis]|uniref:Fibrinogen C-terminal domain-containing protein n=1 Tax=Littorina saxatilis TaxID=31220 RepID=A0AAN9G1W8_9CAEN
MASFLLVFAVLLSPLEAITVTARGNYYKNINHDGKAFTGNILFESPARSAKHCALLCGQPEHRGLCETFTFDGDVCRGHGMLGMFNTSSFVDAPGARSFSKNWEETLPKDCVEAQRYSNESGVVTIYPDDDNSGLQVYCDQDTDGGGWLVFQRRKDGSVDFYRKWAEYLTGFGNVQGEFWLGLDALHMLTSRQRYELRVDLVKFNGTEGYETYSNFTISDSSDNYRLHLGSPTGGNGGDSLSYHNGMQFSTRDADHDTRIFGNCASEHHGAWWYKSCAMSNLNGRYRESREWASEGIVWYYFDNTQYNFKSAEMKMRAM